MNFPPPFGASTGSTAPVTARAPQAPRRLRSPEERRGRRRGAGDDGGHRAVLRRRDRRSGQAPVARAWRWGFNGLGGGET